MYHLKPRVTTKNHAHYLVRVCLSQHLTLYVP